MSAEAKFRDAQPKAERGIVSTLQSTNPLATSDWDKDVSCFDGVSFFHTAAWARVLAETYGFRPTYFTQTTPAGSRSILPAMEVSNLFFRHRGVTLPFTDECKILADNASAVQPFASEFLHRAELKSWTTWEYRGGNSPFPATTASQSFWGHKLQLLENPDELFARIDGNARTSVRKALQQQVSVDFSTDFAAIRIFHRQLCGTRQRHGLPPQPFRFFEAIHRNVLATGLGTVAIARQGGIPVASAVFFHFNKIAIYKFAASDFSFRHLQANHLVLWRAIEHYSRQGFHRLDFGRTSRANQGLRHFKLAWRPEEYPIDYVKYDRRLARFVKGEQERTTGWHNRLFRILPQPAARLIGAVAYRHMA